MDDNVTDELEIHDLPTPGCGAVFDQLELLSEMSQDFVSTGDLEASLSRAVAHITEYVGAEGGALFMLSQDGKKLRCHASAGATEITGMTLDSDQGIVGRSVQENVGEIVRDAQNDARFYKGVDEETGFTTRSILCAPLSVKDQRFGAVELINKKTGDGLFDESDLRLLQTMTASAALAIHNARMAESLVEQEKLARELELAAEIQRSLLPSEPVEDYPIYGLNVPARTVSGDFFDFFALDDGRICFNLGDVSGKGMNAALMMAKAVSIYRCLGKSIDEPGRLMARVNAEICETAARGMFVTMVGGIYDPRSGILRIANAGHEPPLLRTADGTYSSFPADAPPIGISAFVVGDDGYPEETIQLDGGAFYIFTDGVTEGYTVDGEELEVEGVKRMLSIHADKKLNQRLEMVAALIDRDGGPLRDDLTLLAIDDAAAKAVRDTDEPLPLPAPVEVNDETLMVLRIPSRPERLRLVRKGVTEMALSAGCSDETARDMVLAVDEALQNVIRHGYNFDVDGEIEITLRREGDQMIFLIRDHAETVDPTKIKPRELDDIRPGGLGTHFIREVMDEVEFLVPPKDGGNLLKMVRKID
mgnify:CR=1 FL=1